MAGPGVKWRAFFSTVRRPVEDLEIVGRACDNNFVSEALIVEARQVALLSDLADLATVAHSGDGNSLIDGLRFRAVLRRQADYESLEFVADLDRRGEFAERGGRPAVTVADILRCRPVEARRMLALVRSIFPRTLNGQVLEPELPATAAALGAFEIDQAHAEVIERALHSDAARRIPPEQWAGAEVQLAEMARQYRPDELADLAKQLIALLDQDGPAPDEGEPQVNELHLAKSRHGVGGRITGRLDAPTFEVLARAIRAHLMAGDEHGSLGERQAAALGEICEHALDEGRLPAEGGERPHVTIVLDYERLQQLSRGVVLDYGGELSAGQLRRMLCDAKITPVVLGGDSQPLDVGREKRTATLAQRKAVAARDGGCAYPGCDRPAHRCQIHHLRSWFDGGGTDVDNLVTLCIQHHHMVHKSGWAIRMNHGHPEFVPPRWLDPRQTPRRQPPRLRAAPTAA
jgi:5-methylcytosine-specific restriction protein A